MAGWAQTVIIGNVGKDPEMRYLQSGVPVCSFSVAVSRKWTDKQTNERKEETTWYRVSAWRQLAETANQFVHKGMQIMVVGQVKARAYLDTAGQPQASLELNADNMQFLGQRDSAGVGASGEDYNAAENLSDIPF
jgi:single-strand DNA-binding protein